MVQERDARVGPAQYVCRHPTFVTTLADILLAFVHLLEPPGFMLLNFGRSTPLVNLLAHVALAGGFTELSSRLTQ
jgi:hypothetical protein